MTVSSHLGETDGLIRLICLFISSPDSKPFEGGDCYPSVPPSPPHAPVLTEYTHVYSGQPHRAHPTACSPDGPVTHFAKVLVKRGWDRQIKMKEQNSCIVFLPLYRRVILNELLNSSELQFSQPENGEITPCLQSAPARQLEI